MVDGLYGQYYMQVKVRPYLTTYCTAVQSVDHWVAAIYMCCDDIYVWIAFNIRELL